MIGVIGGSGFSEFQADDDVPTDARRGQEVVVDTPYGAPSGPITLVEVEGHAVAFLSRHGAGHRFAAHRVPYRANIWALHSLGVRTIVAPCSAGALQPGLRPGAMVVVDQLVDRTWGRADTFHDTGGPDGEPGTTGPVHHQAFAEPYDDDLRATLIAGGAVAGEALVDGGTVVVINGPRFSTRAESTWFRQMGWHVVNMTGYPEAVLAAELGVRYASIALVTDHDAGLDGVAAVTMDEVFAVMRSNVARVRRVILAAVPGIAALGER